MINTSHIDRMLGKIRLLWQQSPESQLCELLDDERTQIPRVENKIVNLHQVGDIDKDVTAYAEALAEHDLSSTCIVVYDKDGQRRITVGLSGYDMPDLAYITDEQLETQLDKSLRGIAVGDLENSGMPSAPTKE